MSTTCQAGACGTSTGQWWRRRESATSIRLPNRGTGRDDRRTYQQARPPVSEARSVTFAGQPLAPEAPGIASRSVEVNGVRWAVVEYEPSVLREEWCGEGHSGFVLAGEVTYEFEGDDRPPLHVRAGEGLTLPDGASRHRGRAGPEGARLFLIDRAG